MPPRGARRWRWASARRREGGLRSWDFTGWWVYVVGDLVGAIVAVGVIGLVRGLPRRAEEEAAEGGALPMSEEHLDRA